MAALKKINDRPTWNEMKTPKVMERMLELFETTKWHNCVFKLWGSDGTGEELVFAHNLILASSSPVFEALCFGPMAEQSPIEVPDIDPLAFRMTLKFLYTDTIEFDSVEIACNVLYASKKYLISSLAGLAITYISNHINESNCLQVYDCASFVQEDKLIKESWLYLCSHLDYVLKYISNESLSTDVVKNLVNEEALNGAEIVVYKICLMWAEAECERSNLEKSSENLRKVLIKADILNKIRWLTLSLEEFEQGPKKSGILTDEEVKFISLMIIWLNRSTYNPGKSGISKIFKTPELCTMDGSDLQSFLQKINFLPFVNTVIEKRKNIKLEKIFCRRYIEQECKRTLQNKGKISTHIIANKSVSLMGIFLIAKQLPPFVKSVWTVPNSVKLTYEEKLLVSIFDSNDKTLFSTVFEEKVYYEREFKIELPTPVTLEMSKEYRIEVNLFNSSDIFYFGVRNSVSKFPSGLRVTFREKVTERSEDYEEVVVLGKFSIVSGLELCL